MYGSHVYIELTSLEREEKGAVCSVCRNGKDMITSVELNYGGYPTCTELRNTWLGD